MMALLKDLKKETRRDHPQEEFFPSLYIIIKDNHKTLLSWCYFRQLGALVRIIILLVWALVSHVNNNNNVKDNQPQWRTITWLFTITTKPRLEKKLKKVCNKRKMSINVL